MTRKILTLVAHGSERIATMSEIATYPTMLLRSLSLSRVAVKLKVFARCGKHLKIHQCDFMSCSPLLLRKQTP